MMTFSNQSQKDRVMNKLLLIDPQNDFLDQEDASLPVPGAFADIARAAALIRSHAKWFQAAVITLDSHPAIAIERPGFWKDADGKPVVPFTPITHQAVLAGTYAPCNEAHRLAVLGYLQALESGGKYELLVWPKHCVTDTWGWQMPRVLTDALTQSQIPVRHFRKGMNPMTEQYSAVAAEVPLASDPVTGWNLELIEAVRPENGYLVVAGEALSHCVRATMLDLFSRFTAAEVARVVLLTDGMSSVTGFEAQGQAFLAQAEHLGALTMTVAQAEELLESTAEWANVVAFAPPPVV
jgi:nicotinamidase/pyrazinamidase